MTDREIRDAIQPIRIRSEAEVQADAKRERRREYIGRAVIVALSIGLVVVMCAAGGCL